MVVRRGGAVLRPYVRADFEAGPAVRVVSPACFQGGYGRLVHNPLRASELDRWLFSEPPEIAARDVEPLRSNAFRRLSTARLSADEWLAFGNAITSVIFGDDDVEDADLAAEDGHESDGDGSGEDEAEGDDGEAEGDDGEAEGDEGEAEGDEGDQSGPPADALVRQFRAM